MIVSNARGLVRHTHWADAWILGAVMGLPSAAARPTAAGSHGGGR